MIATVRSSTEYWIIKCLAQHSYVSAKDLYSYIAKHYTTVSIQAIYQALKKLQSLGVVIKNKQHYSLRIPWILSLSALVDRMEEMYLHEDYLATLIPTEPGERRTWRFTSFIKMNNFWSQILLALAKQSQSGIMLEYCPILWCELVQQAQEKQFSRAFFASITKQFSIFPKTFLNTYVADLGEEHPNDHYYAFPDSNPILTEPYCLNITDDWVLTIEADPHTLRCIQDMYARVQTMADLDLPEVFSLFTRRTMLKMVLQKNERRAQHYYRKFEHVFGPLEKYA